MAFLMVSVTIVDVDAAPGFERAAGILASRTQTCTVVLLGSVAGLTTVTLPGTCCAGLGELIVAGCPTLIRVAPRREH